MKKSLILGCILVAAMSSAQAYDVSVGRGFESKNQHVTIVDLSKGNLNMAFERDNISRAALGYTLDISNFNNILTVKGEVGVADTCGIHMTYAVEPKISYTKNKMTGYASYKYRTALGSTSDKTHTASAGLSYAIMNPVSVGIKVFNETGDIKNHGVIANIALAF